MARDYYYGKLKAFDLIESVIRVDDDRISFKIPNNQCEHWKSIIEKLFDGLEFMNLTKKRVHDGDIYQVLWRANNLNNSFLMTEINRDDATITLILERFDTLGYFNVFKSKYSFIAKSPVLEINVAFKALP